ncbi:DUF6325 family protein [Actinopolymorpha alba]|uniref:DUF6325 family protein n=1 Tax=Actinopolymorpha alba TaxID=533267 RepID=UPI0003730D7B|nr:DUF6325 family protein [Actinopolymorpha alba]
MAFGPTQILVVGFENGKSRVEILDELRRFRQHDLVCLLDLLFVSKDTDGAIFVETSELTPEEAADSGALTAALVGLGSGETGGEAMLDEDAVWYVADAIPEGTHAMIALLEHRWAIPLRDAVARAGGVALTDEWLHPEDLSAVATKLSGKPPEG